MDAPLLNTPVPGSAPRWQPSAPDSYLLLHGPRADSVEAFKKGLLELIARGVIGFKTFSTRVWLWSTRQEAVLPAGSSDPTVIQTVPSLRSIYDLYLHAAHECSWGAPYIRDLARSARMLEMPLKTYARRVVIPSLLARGLWRSEQHRVLGLFPRTTYVETTRGAAAEASSMAWCACRSAIWRPRWHGIRSRHFSLVGTLGAMLLMDPLFPELARLSQLVSTIPGRIMEVRVSESFDLDTFDLNLGTFDGLAGAFEALSDSLDSGDGGGDGGDGGGGD